MSKFAAARTEEEVGITCRIGKHPRFQATFKARFSDFHVNEVDLNGKIVQLTSLAPPPEKKSDYAEDDPEIVEWIPEDVRKRISELQTRLESASREGERLPKSDKIWKERVEIKVTALSKDERTKIHKWIGNFDKLCSETVDKDGDKFIVAVYDNKNNRTRRRPATRAKYTHFTLYKEGVDTSEAIGQLTKKLRIKPNFITFCGTKDKHGKTAQRMCVSNIDAHRLVQISRELRSIKLGNFEYLPYHLRLGDLKGNHFKILLKNVTSESDDWINAAVESLKSTGFINYFGLQRFGSYEVATHAVGKKILQNDWIAAFDLILKPKNNDSDSMAKAKKKWFDNRDPQAAIQFLPSYVRSIESGLLHGLANYYSRNDFVGVFLRLPRNTRHLYIHSLQSYLWNQLASFRINKMGIEPVVGDLVFVDKEQGDFYVEDILEEDEAEEEPEAGNGQESSTDKKGPARSVRVKALAEEDLPNYTIFDVVIPIQGTQIQIPESRIRDIYEEILKEQGLDMDCFLKFKPFADQPKGPYRKLIIRPQNVTHKIISYNESDPVDTFIPSELDKLNADREQERQRRHATATKKENDSATGEEIANPPTELVKDKKCVIVEMSLPASSYATMALREVMVPNVELSNNSPAVPVIKTESPKRCADKNGGDELEPEAERRRGDNSEK